MIEPADRKSMANVSRRPDSRNVDLPGKPPGAAQSPAIRDADRTGAGPAATTAGAQPAEPSLRLALERLIQGAWRRRLLLVVPILVMIPMSIAVALLMPRPYVARTLLLLQETHGGNPLAREPRPSRIQERIGGLEALLKSDQVPSRVVGDIGVGDDPPGPQAVATRIQDLRRALQIELIGTDFLEIRLKGDRSQGLGRELEAVTMRFIEALTADQGVMSAGQMLVRQRREEAQAAEAALADLRARLSGLLSGGLDSSAERPQSVDAAAELQQRISAAEREAALAQEAYQTSLRRYGNPGPGRGLNLLNAPERIKVIDPPEDPKLATMSRLLFVLSGLAASVLLGVGLAWAAEMLDQTIRREDELAAAAGVPVVARLPRIAGNVVRLPERSGGRRTRERPKSLLRATGLLLLALAAIVGMAALGYRLTAGPEVTAWISGAFTAGARGAGS